MRKFITSISLTAAIFLTISTPGKAGMTEMVSGVSSKVRVYNLSYDGQNLIGQVLNQRGTILNYVKVNYTVFNAQGSQISSESIYLKETALAPGQNGTFMGATQAKGASVVVRSVEWLGDTDSLSTCNIPNEHAVDGSSCGGRAASERPGGQLQPTSNKTVIRSLH